MQANREGSARRADPRLPPHLLVPWRKETSRRHAAAEAIGLMLAGVLVSTWLRPHDPFWIEAGFPWLWLLSTAIALRYGSIQGVMAVITAAASWLAIDHLAGSPLAFPRVDFFGGLVLTLVAGNFADVWTTRLNQARAASAYLDERLQSLTRKHFLLGVSHERLEQELIARPYTLREMMVTLRGLILTDTSTALPASAWLLQFLVQTTRLESAALHAWDGRRLEPQPVAAIGDPGKLALEDAMLRAALDSGELTHVQSRSLAATAGGTVASHYLICAPLRAASGRLLGVLVVRGMAFTALTQETLRFMTVTLGYYADGVDAAAVARPIVLANPACPPAFATELARLARIETLTGMRSALVAFVVREDSATPASDWFTRIRRLRRATDLDWQTSRGGRRTLVVLLPLVSQAGVAGYLERIDESLREQYGLKMGTAGVTVHSSLIDHRPALDQLQDFLSRLDA